MYCRTCKKQLNRSNDVTFDDRQLDSGDDVIFDVEHEVENTVDLDESLAEYGISPIKKHSKSSIHKVSEMKRKLQTAENSIQLLKQGILGEQDNSFQKNKMRKSLI